MASKEIDYFGLVNQLAYDAWLAYDRDHAGDLEGTRDSFPMIDPKPYHPETYLDHLMSGQIPAISDFSVAFISQMKLIAAPLIIHLVAQKMGIDTEVAAVGVVATAFISTGFPLIKKMIINRMRRI